MYDENFGSAVKHQTKTPQITVKLLKNTNKIIVLY